MGTIREAKPVKAICAVTFVEDVVLSEVAEELEKILGSVEDRTPTFDFSFTTYYREEMGSELKKVFLSFVRLVDPGSLPRIKNKTNLIEESWSVEGKRRINLDPGYITGAKLVLASTKDFAHRIFLGDGIYGDIQLQFRQNRFRTEKWTFPDYQTNTAIDFFERVRKKYVREVKNGVRGDEL